MEGRDALGVDARPGRGVAQAEPAGVVRALPGEHGLDERGSGAGSTTGRGAGVDVCLHGVLLASSSRTLVAAR